MNKRTSPSPDASFPPKKPRTGDIPPSLSTNIVGVSSDGSLEVVGSSRARRVTFAEGAAAPTTKRPKRSSARCFDPHGPLLFTDMYILEFKKHLELERDAQRMLLLQNEVEAEEHQQRTPHSADGLRRDDGSAAESPNKVALDSFTDEEDETTEEMAMYDEPDGPRHNNDHNDDSNVPSSSNSILVGHRENVPIIEITDD